MPLGAFSWAAVGHRIARQGVILAVAAVSLQTNGPAMAAVVPVTDGLIVWLRADATQRSGTTVTDWLDCAGTGTGIGDNLSQDAVLVLGGPSYDPVNTINGWPTVRFGGGGAYEYEGQLDIGGQHEFTVFIVATSEKASESRVFAIGDIDNDINDGTGGASAAFDVGTTTTGIRFNNGNRLFNETFDSDPHIGVWRMAAPFKYGSVEYWLDGVLGTQASSSNPNGIINLFPEGYSLGMGISSGGGYTNGFLGNLAEVLLYNRALADREINAVGFYLATKYALETAFVPEPATEGLFLLGGAIALVGFGFSGGAGRRIFPPRFGRPGWLLSDLGPVSKNG